MHVFGLQVISLVSCMSDSQSFYRGPASVSITSEISEEVAAGANLEVWTEEGTHTRHTTRIHSLGWQCPPLAVRKALLHQHQNDFAELKDTPGWSYHSTQLFSSETVERQIQSRHLNRVAGN